MTIAHIYFAFLIIGVIGMLGSLLFGDADSDINHDLGDNNLSFNEETDSPKILSLRIIFSFLLAFSLGGGSLYLMGKSLPYQLIAGFISGSLIAIGVFQFMKFLYSFQGTSNIDSNNFVGSLAKVSIETTDSGLCQIEINSTGGDRLFMAQELNRKKLKRNDTVRIIGRVGSNLLIEKI